MSGTHKRVRMSTYVSLTGVLVNIYERVYTNLRLDSALGAKSERMFLCFAVYENTFNCLTQNFQSLLLWRK